MTTYKPTYWRNKGKFQEDYDRLYEKYRFASNETETTHLDLLGSVSTLYYDIYNNNGCNCLSHECLTILTWTDKIQKAGGTKTLKDLSRIFEHYTHPDYLEEALTEKEMRALDRLVDIVVQLVKEQEEGSQKPRCSRKREKPENREHA